MIFDAIPGAEMRHAQFGRIRVAAATYSGDVPITAHRHRLVLLVSHRGRMLVRTGQGRSEARSAVPWRGGLLLANPQCARIAPTTDRGRHEAIAVAIPLGALDAPLLVGTALASGRDGVLPIPIESMIVGSAEPFVAQVLAGRLAAGSVLALQMEILLQQIMRTLVVEATANAAPGEDGLYARALSVIAQRFSESELDSEAVADEVGVSRRGLERAFRAQGDTIGRAVRRTRIETAERLLHHGVAPRPTVAHTAALVGYSSGASLARAMATEGRPAPRTPRD